MDHGPSGRHFLVVYDRYGVLSSLAIMTRQLECKQNAVAHTDSMCFLADMTRPYAWL